VGEGRAYVNDLNGTLVALDLADGSEQWRFELGAPAYASPALVDDVVYAVSEAGGLLHALDADSGEALWQYQTGRQGDYRSSSPVVLDGVLYVGSNSGGLLALAAADA
jgi:outer membrane protein assembly factor BamB